MVLENLPNYEAPPSLVEFAASRTDVDYDPETNEIFLYHGTNCYRRWEINRTGFLEPGRNNYSFFCTRAEDAFAYARTACLRDIGPDAFNSLICEPVVLKAKFTARTWLQVDFLQSPQNDTAEQKKTARSEGLTVAVLGPTLVSNIVEVLHCNHAGKGLAGGLDRIRTFEDGEFLRNIRHLRDSLQKKRPDMWLLRKLGFMADKVGVTLKGGEVPALTHDDQLRKLRQRSVET
ncbi:MAG: hypothetical protein KGS72_00260 [Cyanobacteria bacterium REEB67]|nr:hypothetical protein [Cyanobacteria bacterium REEB67]